MNRGRDEMAKFEVGWARMVLYCFWGSGSLGLTIVNIRYGIPKRLMDFSILPFIGQLRHFLVLAVCLDLLAILCLKAPLMPFSLASRGAIARSNPSNSRLPSTLSTICITVESCGVLVPYHHRESSLSSGSGVGGRV